ncbi:hypothetical protein B0T14DRAFT_248275 [Immersiella caudata]|uniref:Uncharacterized protein n=1 Tax=Immersiella caudata TaxID=314043 RepID=A0AA39WJD3_9PEZI|nr:hypothetical protein B0T14DRAFT_248275 [Immersiella caudata]
MANPKALFSKFQKSKSEAESSKAGGSEAESSKAGGSKAESFKSGSPKAQSFKAGSSESKRARRVRLQTVSRTFVHVFESFGMKKIKTFGLGEPLTAGVPQVSKSAATKTIVKAPDQQTEGVKQDKKDIEVDDKDDPRPPRARRRVRYPRIVARSVRTIFRTILGKKTVQQSEKKAGKQPETEADEQSEEAGILPEKKAGKMSEKKAGKQPEENADEQSEEEAGKMSEKKAGKQPERNDGASGSKSKGGQSGGPKKALEARYKSRVGPGARRRSL